jgi:glutathione synthase/RimK-type ligase-like ATP-grasp enzyme
MNSGSEFDIVQTLERARALVATAQDDAAKQSYLEILRHDPTHVFALNELGTLAYSGGYRSAARTAYLQAVHHHPGNKAVRVNLANLLREENDLEGARLHYAAALAVDQQFPEAHQGMAAVLRELGLEGADHHLQTGYSGHAVVTRPYRGTERGLPLLMLVSARGGNIPTNAWIQDREFAVTAIYAEFHDVSAALPPHALILNAIGDADLCGVALARAEEIVARSTAVVINSPARVRVTGRAENARRLAAIAGVIAPKTRAMSSAVISADEKLSFPLLLRRPGFHTGQHFVRVENRAALGPVLADLGADELFVIQYLDARGSDGMARKYRVMFIDGVLYPLHLAISADWKVHYFSADMSRCADYREEERRFLQDMPSVLGTRAMGALAKLFTALGLEYAGVDFALAPDGSLLLFEANATMAVFPPGAEATWDYRRSAINRVLQAANQMLRRHAHGGANRA